MGGRVCWEQLSEDTDLSSSFFSTGVSMMEYLGIGVMEALSGQVLLPISTFWTEQKKHVSAGGPLLTHRMSPRYFRAALALGESGMSTLPRLTLASTTFPSGSITQNLGKARAQPGADAARGSKAGKWGPGSG